MNQKVKDPLWIDETGLQIPVARINPVERLMEQKATLLANRAVSLNKSLIDFKVLVKDMCAQVYAAFMKSKGINPEETDSKGFFTWFNFDRTIKIEVSVSDRIAFDDLTINAAQEKLNQFLDETVASKFDFVKDLVQDAFKTSRGKLDAKKVMSLLKHRERINHPLFNEATALIESSIRRPDKKTYFRIWIKGEDGEYQLVDLNFSNI